MHTILLFVLQNGCLVCDQYQSINWKKRQLLLLKQNKNNSRFIINNSQEIMAKRLIDVNSIHKNKTTANDFPNWQKAARSSTNVGSIARWNKPERCMIPK